MFAHSWKKVENGFDGRGIDDIGDIFQCTTCWSFWMWVVPHGEIEFMIIYVNPGSFEFLKNPGINTIVNIQIFKFR